MRVVWHGEGIDLQIAEAEPGAGFEELPRQRVFHAVLHGAGGGGVSEEGDLRSAGEAGDAGRVVAVLVGEENGVDFLGLEVLLGEQLACPSRRESHVDQHARLLGLQQGAVA